MKDIKTIFETFGGPAKMAHILNVKPSAASMMLQRRVIPVRHWPALVQKAKEKRVAGITYNNLVALYMEGCK